MTSLFDIAADLSQYNDEGDSAVKVKLQAVDAQSAIGILNETFETIYNAQQYRSASKRPLLLRSATVAQLQPTRLPLIRSATMMHLQPTRFAESKSSEALNVRLNQLTSLRSSASAPRQMTHTIPDASLIIPPPPSVAPPHKSRKKKSVDENPDVTAKAILREVTTEINQLMMSNSSSSEEEESLLRMLVEKYIHTRLSKLPGTPFVLLMRKKVAQKLQQLEQHLKARRTISKQVVTDGGSSNNSVLQVTTGKSLQTLTPAQQEMLQNLLCLPEKQLLKLPKAQLELVQFAKRYEKLVKATPDQLRHLPLEHQKLIRSMQQHQKQLSRTDEQR